MLLAAFDARRPTRDVDLAAIDVSNDLEHIRRLVNEVITVGRDDGLKFDPTATSVAAIRDDERYGGARVKVHCALASGVIQFHVDVSIGDPLWPPPSVVDLPRLLGGPPIRVCAYRVELVLAEKIVTAMQRGTANTRWRDFVDIAGLAQRDVDEQALVESITRVAAYRHVPIESLGAALTGFAPRAQGRWAAWRRRQRLDTTPESFAALLDRVVVFTDPLLQQATAQS